MLKKISTLVLFSTLSLSSLAFAVDFPLTVKTSTCKVYISFDGKAPDASTVATPTAPYTNGGGKISVDSKLTITSDSTCQKTINIMYDVAQNSVSNNGEARAFISYPTTYPTDSYINNAILNKGSVTANVYPMRTYNNSTGLVVNIEQAPNSK